MVGSIGVQVYFLVNMYMCTKAVNKKELLEVVRGVSGSLG